MKNLMVLLMFMIAPLIVTSQELKGIDFISPFNDGLCAIQKDGKWGFIDLDGTLIVDYRDDLVLKTIGDDTFPVFNSGRCLIVKNEDDISYFGYIDKSGKTVIKPQFLNATHFNDNIAVIIELHKNTLGTNDVLGKKMIDYSYTESAINPDGEIIHYLSDKPTHITLSKDYVKTPPIIKTRFLSEKLVAFKDENNSWSIKKI